MMMSHTRARLAAIAFIAALALLPSAHAGEDSPAELPISLTLSDDFAESPELARPLLYKLQAEVHLGGLRSRAHARAWHSERAPATVFVTWFVTEDAIELPDVAIHSEFEQLRTTPERVALSPSDARSLAFETGVSGQAATAALRWRHLGYQTETQVRALAFQTAEGHLYFVQTDCVYPMPEEAAAASAAAGAPEAVCEALLAGIEPATSVGALRPPRTDVAARPGDAPTAAPDVTESPGSATTVPAPQLTVPIDGQPMPAIAIEREHKRDYTSYLYILGGVLLLLAFYFTARSRNASKDDADTKAE